MSIFETIKKNIPIDELLKDIGFQINERTKEIYDTEEGKFSDSYNYSKIHNIVTNHNKSKTYRVEGNPYNVYVSYMNCTTEEALEYFEKRWGIKRSIQEKQEHIHEPPMIPKEVITDDKRVSSYLEMRGIYTSKLPSGLVGLVNSKVHGKNAPEGETLCLSVPMRDMKGEIISYQYRSLLMKGFHTNGPDGFFYHIDKNLKQDYIFVVEGMTDFLSLRQLTQQVIGLKSSSVNLSEPRIIDLVAFLSKFKKVYLLFDDDKAGMSARDKFIEGIDANIYGYPEIDYMGGWDINLTINNYLTDCTGDDIIEMLLGMPKIKEKSFEHITYTEGVNIGFDELRTTKVEDVMSWGVEEFDKKLGYMMGGELIVVGGITGAGKTTFVNNIAMNVASQGFTVCRYSLEDRMETARKNDIYYETVRIRKAKKAHTPPHYLFEANNYESKGIYFGIESDIERAVLSLKNKNRGIIDLHHNKMLSITDIENLLKDVVLNRNAKLIIIDHLHYIKRDDYKNQNTAQSIEKFMHELNDIVRRYNITCILVSHYRKLEKGRMGEEVEPTNDDFKDGVSISQVPDKIIHVIKGDIIESDEIRSEGEQPRVASYIISKNRGKEWTGRISGRFDNGKIVMKNSELMEKRRGLRKL